LVLGLFFQLTKVVSRVHEVVDHWSVSAHGPPWIKRHDGGDAHRRWMHDHYGARVLTIAARGGGGGWGGPHQRQKMATAGGFRPAAVVNGGGLGCSLRSGSRMRKRGNGSGNRAWWRQDGSRWLL
jgi:hypothetical protein